MITACLAVSMSPPDEEGVDGVVGVVTDTAVGGGLEEDVEGGLVGGSVASAAEDRKKSVLSYSYAHCAYNMPR